MTMQCLPNAMRSSNAEKETKPEQIPPSSICEAIKYFLPKICKFPLRPRGRTTDRQTWTLESENQKPLGEENLNEYNPRKENTLVWPKRSLFPSL